jgi:hypothetical protein
MPTSSINMNGRFCNHFIRNICVSILAKKYDLRTEYSYASEIKSFGIVLFNGTKDYSPRYTLLNDSNYMHYLNYNGPIYNSNFSIAINVYLQTKEITNMLYTYLHSQAIQAQIISANKFNARYNSNNDIFVHVRLGDVIHFNPGFLYYKTAIDKVIVNNPGTIYLASDTITHDICNKIRQAYANVVNIRHDYIDTIKFGSTCKYVILSHGSFSATIGYLSFFSKVYYPRYPNQMWHGDIFSIPGWNMVSF